MTDVLHSSFPLEHHHELGRLLHLRALLARGHRHVVVRELERHTPDSALPERAVVVRTVQAKHERRVIAEVDDALVLLETWRADAQAVVSADDEQAATAIADEIVARVPQPTGAGRVEVVFSDECTGSRTMDLDVRPWQDVADHYPAPVRAALDSLAAYVPDAGSPRGQGPGSGRRRPATAGRRGPSSGSRCTRR